MSNISAILDVAGSLKVISSGDRERIKKNAAHEGVIFDEHDPQNIIVGRLTEILSDRLESIAQTVETEGGNR